MTSPNQPQAEGTVEVDSSDLPEVPQAAEETAPQPDPAEPAEGGTTDVAEATQDNVDFSTPQVVETPETPDAPAQTDDAQIAETDAQESTTGGTAIVAGSEGSIMKPITGFGDKKSRVTVLGGSDEADADQSVAEVGGENLDLPALLRYGAAFEDAGGAKMAIVLITDSYGQMGTTDNVLPLPISYAINAAEGDTATALMQRARQTGQEAIAIMPLPDRASASDVEVAFAEYLNTMGEAVAIMDTPEAAFQSFRDTASQVVAITAADGHGLIAYPQGFNSALQMAEREGVAAAPVFRVIDDAGQDRAAIKRFLDQAAFRAGQQDDVIVVGHDRAETVAAILEWSLGNRASNLQLAPVSALLAAGR